MPKIDFNDMALLDQFSSDDPMVSAEAGRKIAGGIKFLYTASDEEREQALAAEPNLPLRKGVMDGSNTAGIFTETSTRRSTTSYEYPLDLIAPGTEADFVALTMPDYGAVPNRIVEGDYLQIPIYGVGNRISMQRRFARNADWNVVGRLQEVLIDGVVKKHNDDAWHTILGAGYDRNIVVTDPDAASGQFTKRLVSLMQVVMRRGGGGNETSMFRSRLTDMYLSPEAMEGIRNWNVDQVDEITRREIFVSTDEQAINRIFGVNLHTMSEFGVGQEYETYYESTLGASLPSNKVEICVGLDLSTNDAFLRPIPPDGALEVTPDMLIHPQQLLGFYCMSYCGWACVDNRRVLIGAM